MTTDRDEILRHFPKHSREIEEMLAKAKGTQEARIIEDVLSRLSRQPSRISRIWKWVQAACIWAVLATIPASLIFPRHYSGVKIPPPQVHTTQFWPDFLVKHASLIVKCIAASYGLFLIAAFAIMVIDQARQPPSRWRR